MAELDALEPLRAQTGSAQTDGHLSREGWEAPVQTAQVYTPRNRTFTAPEPGADIKEASSSDWEFNVLTGAAAMAPKTLGLYGWRLDWLMAGSDANIKKTWEAARVDMQRASITSDSIAAGRLRTKEAEKGVIETLHGLPEQDRYRVSREASMYIGTWGEDAGSKKEVEKVPGLQQACDQLIDARKNPQLAHLDVIRSKYLPALEKDTAESASMRDLYGPILAETGRSGKALVNITTMHEIYRRNREIFWSAKFD